LHPNAGGYDKMGARWFSALQSVPGSLVAGGEPPVVVPVISLRARVNGRYVCAESGGTQPLIANRDAVGQWEKFLMIRNADGSVSLKANVNGKYVAAENVGNSSLVANRTAIGFWERFDLIG
jgi:hypothetical protein